MKTTVYAVSVAVLIAAVSIFVTGCAKSDETATTAGPKGAEVATAQKMCPVMGGAIDKNIYADHDGKRVYFCCPACLQTFKDDPAKYVKKLEDAGVTLEKAS